MLACVLVSACAAHPVAAPTVHHDVVIDTDAGPDDLMAIAFLLSRPDVRIEAITVVNGLASVDVGADNVLRLLDLAGADRVPVYIGASSHLQPTRAFPPSYRDKSEQTGAAAAPTTQLKPQTRGAIPFLVSVLQSAPPSMEILALGPLTNLAHAIREVGPRNVRPLRIVIMGGGFDVPGNLPAPEFVTTNDRSEWNLYSDPAAAREVFASPLRVELIGLDATNRVRMDTCIVAAIEHAGNQPLQKYVFNMLNGARQWIERGDYYAWDLLAAVALVQPDVVRLAPVGVDVQLEPPHEGATRRAANGHAIRFASSADPQRFGVAYVSALGGMRHPPEKSVFCH